MNPPRGNHEPFDLVLCRFGRSLRVWIVKQDWGIRPFIMNPTGPTMNPLAWCFVAMQFLGSFRIKSVVHAYLLHPDRHERLHGQCLHAARRSLWRSSRSRVFPLARQPTRRLRASAPCALVTIAGTTKKRGTPKGPPLLCSWLSHLRLGPQAHRCSSSGPGTGTGRAR
jgi:hypothetical protein